jgi:NAD(P)-dependent dehydrogenase (short-subunit alcohol dehydrogenase family)
MTDQYSFDNPVTRYPSITPPEQHQSAPGSEQDLTPQPDLGDSTYRGTGRLAGRKALITGADSGIGAAVAIAFAREGADVALCYLPEEHEDARRVVALAEEAGGIVAAIPGDITDPQFCRVLVESAVDQLGGLDVLVNVAGVQHAVDTLEELDDEQFDRTFRTNVYAMFWITKAALPHLAEGSCIINTTSIQAYKPSPELLDYAATKAAINNFTKGLSQQLAPKGIRVNAVAPGPVWTVLQASGGQKPEALPEFGQSTPIGRPGQPAELAPAYVFLASSESSFVIGDTLNVNGGQPTP